MAAKYLLVCQATVYTKVKEQHYECNIECLTLADATAKALERQRQILSLAERHNDDARCVVTCWSKIYSLGPRLCMARASHQLRAKAHGEEWKVAPNGILK